MSWLRIRNWDKWQTYRKDRGQPPWIKIHRALMRDDNWVELTDAERGQLVAMWMLAADKNGVIPASPITIRKLTFMEREPDLQVFISKGFIDKEILDAIPAPARRQPDATVTHQSRVEEKRDRVERDDDAKEASSTPAGDEFAFKGRFVKGVNEDDFSGWLKSYPTFTRDSMMAELRRCDEYYGGKGANTKSSRNWFFTAEAWIRRTHDRAVDDSVKAKDRVLPSGRVMDEDEYRAMKGVI